MVSFIRFDHFTYWRNYLPSTGLLLQTMDENGSVVTPWREMDHKQVDTFVWKANAFILNWKAPDHFKCFFSPDCFQMLLSHHPEGERPERFSSGLYNCSVGFYQAFRKHLDCNLKVECEDGRDETGHCPFSSPACQGWIASNRKCFKYVEGETLKKPGSSETSSYRRAIQYCESLQSSLSVPKDEETEFKVFQPLFQSIRLDTTFTVFGMFLGGPSVPSMYRLSFRAQDKTVLHHAWFNFKSIYYQSWQWCFGVFRNKYIARSCGSAPFTSAVAVAGAVCETHNRTDGFGSLSVSLPTMTLPPERAQVNLTTCPDGQLTHVFRPCSGQREPDIAFTCGTDPSGLLYTLVCDFHQDCRDGSDESFCRHPACSAFACSNGQCLSYTKRCNIVSDCADGSDEEGCSQFSSTAVRVDKLSPPVLVDFDGTGSFTYRKMVANETCPVTHFRCPGEHNDCLPVYTRCNGWNDCIHHEDEHGCEGATCPGFYRCLLSAVCVGTGHVCDGWPHCPRADDEWLCGLTCPASCHCQGHAFVCPQRFPAHLFPQLRYLDAAGSAMTLTELRGNPYMTRLALAFCSLTVLPVVHMDNLQSLDLSHNQLQLVNMTTFVVLKNLVTLSLANNPIEQIVKYPSSLQQTALRILDLSKTKLAVFKCKPLSNFFYMHTLNLSFTAIHTIGSEGFQCTARLAKLYLKGSPVQNFPADLFKPLSYLRVVSADTYKLCCQNLLPSQSGMMECDAPEDEVSSCEDLLQRALYRVFLWVIGSLSLLGNVFCLVMRTCAQSRLKSSGFYVLVCNLSIADLLMGVYVAMIGAADQVYRGEYLHYDQTWTSSAACQVAGFVSLLSSEVSALSIWLITLDRCLVIRFPFSRVRFHTASAAVACVLVWTAGLLLALIPLLPATFHWRFYSQTGICIPLPVTRRYFKGEDYSVGIFIVLNFVLFLFIAAGQAFIYWSVQMNSLKTNSTKVSRDLSIARRLMSVAVTDFLCWFPIGLCGLLASANSRIPGEVNVALAVFVLPLNSALNPFIYTFNVLLEKRRKTKEALLVQWLESHLDFAEKFRI